MLFNEHGQEHVRRCDTHRQDHGARKQRGGVTFGSHEQPDDQHDQAREQHSLTAQLPRQSR
jgi:hypothetical protein